MVADFQPKGSLIKKRSRLQVERAVRKFQEKPSWWFRRFLGYYETAQAREPEYRLRQDQLVEIYLHHSGLDQKEKQEIWKDVDAKMELFGCSLNHMSPHRQFWTMDCYIHMLHLL